MQRQPELLLLLCPSVPRNPILNGVERPRNPTRPANA